MITLYYAYKYVLYIPTNIRIIYCYLYYNQVRKMSHNYFHIDTKLKHMDLFNLWTQRRGEQHSDDK